MENEDRKRKASEDAEEPRKRTTADQHEASGAVGVDAIFVASTSGTADADATSVASAANRPEPADDTTTSDPTAADPNGPDSNGCYVYVQPAGQCIYLYDLNYYNSPLPRVPLLDDHAAKSRPPPIPLINPMQVGRRFGRPGITQWGVSGSVEEDPFHVYSPAELGESIKRQRYRLALRTISRWKNHGYDCIGSAKAEFAEIVAKETANDMFRKKALGWDIYEAGTFGMSIQEYLDSTKAAVSTTGRFRKF